MGLAHRVRPRLYTSPNPDSAAVEAPLQPHTVLPSRVPANVKWNHPQLSPDYYGCLDRMWWGASDARFLACSQVQPVCCVRVLRGRRGLGGSSICATHCAEHGSLLLTCHPLAA